MDFNEAAGHARKMKRSFDAFAKLEDMLTATALSESVLVETQGAKAKLDAELAEMRLAVLNLKKQEKALQAKLTEQEADLATYKKGAELKAFLASQEAKRVSALAKIESEIADAREEADQAKASFYKEIEVAKREYDLSETRLGELQKLVSQLRQRIEGLS